MALTKAHNRMVENAAANVKDFGAVGDGTTDDTTAVQAALDSGSSVVYMPEGIYKVAEQLTCPANVSIYGDGKEKSVITAAGVTAGSFTDFAVLFKSGTAPTQIAELASNVTKTTRTLDFASAHGLSVGDIILIYNPSDSSFSGYRASYRAGEYCTVSSVPSTTQITIEGGLYAPYNAANVDVYKCGGYGSGFLRDFSVVASEVHSQNIQAIRIDYCTGLDIQNVGASNSVDAGLRIFTSYKVRAHNLTCTQLVSSPIGTGYGLSIANVQEIDVTGDFVATNDPVSHGGGNTFSIPTRASNIHDSVCKKIDLSGLGYGVAIDWHGNCEWCVIDNCLLYGGGVHMAGNNNRVSNVKVYGNASVVLGREILGCNHIFENIQAFTSFDGSGVSNRRTIDIGGNSDAMTTNCVYGGTMTFTNISVENDTDTRGLIQIRNRGASVDWNVVADRITYVAPNALPASFPVVSINTVSGSDPEKVGSTNIDSELPPLECNTISVAPLLRQDALSGKASLSTTTGASFVDAAQIFNSRFAKEPSVTVSIENNSTGSDTIGCYAPSPSATGFTFRVARTDSLTNFSAAITVEGQWIATLREW